MNSNSQLAPTLGNPETERNILGAIFADRSHVATVAELMEPFHFSVPLHGRIFSVILAFDRERVDFDEILVSERLGDDRDFVDAGGVAYLASISNLVHRRAPVREYCKVVRDLALRQQMRHLSYSVEQAASDNSISQADRIEQIENRWAEIRDTDLNSASEVFDVDQLAEEEQPDIERLRAGKSLAGVSTGFVELDAVMPGWVPGELVILAARPSVGKTALAIEFSLRLARQGHAVVFFSLEMSRKSILRRMVCRDARLSFSSYMRGEFLPWEWRKFDEALARIRVLPIRVGEGRKISATQIRWKIKTAARRHNARLVIVDYLGLVAAKAENRTNEITKVSAELKAAAADVHEVSGGTLLALSQLNRELEKFDRQPQLSDLRDSGAIEQDGDVILMLHNEQKADGPGCPQPTVKLLHIRKQRNGPTDSVKLMYLPVCMGFEPYKNEVE